MSCCNPYASLPSCLPEVGVGEGSLLLERHGVGVPRDGLSQTVKPGTCPCPASDSVCDPGWVTSALGLHSALSIWGVGLKDLKGPSQGGCFGSVPVQSQEWKGREHPVWSLICTHPTPTLCICNGYFLSGLAEAQKAAAPGRHCFLPKSKSSALAFFPQQLERKSSLSRALIFLLQDHGP